MAKVSPEDFLSHEPPVRTIGTECEYLPQGVKGADGVAVSIDPHALISKSRLHKARLPSHRGMLGSEGGAGYAYIRGARQR
jgi:hypothetical protein